MLLTAEERITGTIASCTLFRSKRREGGDEEKKKVVQKLKKYCVYLWSPIERPTYISLRRPYQQPLADVKPLHKLTSYWG